MEQGTRPKRYRIEFIEPGLISYHDIGEGTVLVQRPALDKMRPTFVGMPVFNEAHQDNDVANAENAFDYSSMSPEERDKYAVGVVTDVGTKDTGWDYADVVIWDQDTQTNIDDKGYAASCAYIPTEQEPGNGKSYHNIAYDREVTDGFYTHMAIVPNPRYEGTKVYANSKGDSMNPLKIFIKKSSPQGAAPAKPQQHANAGDPPPKDTKGGQGNGPAAGGDMTEQNINANESYVDFGGNKIPLSEAVDAYMQKKNAGTPAPDEEALSPDSVIQLPDGQQITVQELLEALGDGNQNATDKPNGTIEPIGEPAEPVVASQHTNARPAANANFQKVRTAVASSRSVDIKPDVKTKNERLQLGNSRYGKAVPVTGGAK